MLLTVSKSDISSSHLDSVGLPITSSEDGSSTIVLLRPFISPDVSTKTTSWMTDFLLKTEVGWIEDGVFDRPPVLTTGETMELVSSALLPGSA